MKSILMGNGMSVLVDDGDFEELSKWNWTAHFHRSGGGWYSERNAGNNKTILMHRQIMKVIKGMIVDHKDRNGLNNQRSNLRIATRSQNNANRRASINSRTSKFLGVAYEKDRKKWTARIRKDWKGYRLGSFDTEVEAARAYNAAATIFHGEFANLNKL